MFQSEPITKRPGMPKPFAHFLYIYLVTNFIGKKQPFLLQPRRSLKPLQDFLEIFSGGMSKMFVGEKKTGS